VVVKSFKDKRIRYFKNKRNLGYASNLENARKKAKGDILYLMGADDILGKEALQNTYRAFLKSKDIGAVTRPYYWFDDDILKPVRAKKQLNPKKDEVVKITDDYEKIITVFSTLDQLSGLAYRVKYFDIPFHIDCFPSHIYPFASIFKKHPIVFLKDYNLAVRIGTSQTIRISSIYERSPMKSWIDMFNSVFKEKKYAKVRKYLIKNFVAVNYIGLVQIRNFARYRYLLREIYYLIKYRWQNFFNPQFWFFSLGTMIIPRSLLVPLVSWYKKNIYSQTLKHIRFVYKL